MAKFFLIFFFNIWGVRSTIHAPHIYHQIGDLDGKPK
jgi:hypothetical protein